MIIRYRYKHLQGNESKKKKNTSRKTYIWLDLLVAEIDPRDVFVFQTQCSDKFFYRGSKKGVQNTTIIL